ncbi:hypothetical protein Pla52n_10310 [Stieleria varia]|uniref:Uncharacterized protein n=1 Tax=Stieleria varia TaxID=2528005 RepID=A0A5C6B908_9BACT|nr:hypothetical protein Pla52n_10310 [Stieleria varia]
MHRPVLILGLAVLALATVVSRKPWLTPKRLIYRTHVLRLDDALAPSAHSNNSAKLLVEGAGRSCTLPRIYRYYFASDSGSALA